MNSKDNPFQALDKALLSPTQAWENAREETGRNREDKETRKQGNKLFRKQASHQESPKKGASAVPICFEPDSTGKLKFWRKQTFEFSKEELDFLNEVKFHLRELGVTKNKVVRTALELLAKDYQANKEVSFLVRKFTRRQGNKLTD
jgi:hypothetical protein